MLDLKVGDIEKNIDELLKKYSPNFIKIGSGNADVKKYHLTEKLDNEKYIIIGSTVDHKLNPYNFMITVMGPNKNNMDIIVNNFQNKTGIKLRDGPNYLKQMYKKMGF